MSHISISNTIINATEFVNNLEKAFTSINIPHIKALLKHFHNAKCKRAKTTLAATLIDKAIQHCTRSDDIQLDHSPLFVFNYSLTGQDVSIQFDEGKVHFITTKPLPLEPGEIIEVQLDFTTNIQNIPELSSDICNAIAISPCIQFVPQLTIPTISLANCTTSEYLGIPEDTILLTLAFPASQVLGISRDIKDILSYQNMDRNVVNFAFLKYISQAISKIATQSYAKDISSFSVIKTKKKHVSVPTKAQNNGPPEAPDNVPARAPGSKKTLTSDETISGAKHEISLPSTTEIRILYSNLQHLFIVYYARISVLHQLTLGSSNCQT